MAVRLSCGINCRRSRWTLSETRTSRPNTIIIATSSITTAATGVAEAAAVVAIEAVGAAAARTEALAVTGVVEADIEEEAAVAAVVVRRTCIVR